MHELKLSFSLVSAGSWRISLLFFIQALRRIHRGHSSPLHRVCLCLLLLVLVVVRRPEALEMVKILRQFAQSANEGEIMKSFPLPSIQTWSTSPWNATEGKSETKPRSKIIFCQNPIFLNGNDLRELPLYKTLKVKIYVVGWYVWARKISEPTEPSLAAPPPFAIYICTIPPFPPIGGGQGCNFMFSDLPFMKKNLNIHHSPKTLLANRNPPWPILFNLLLFQKNQQRSIFIDKYSAS